MKTLFALLLAGLLGACANTSTRFVALEKTVQKIEGKRASGQSLNYESKAAPK